jgi:cysteinyl-tRNA synthetase
MLDKINRFIEHIGINTLESSNANISDDYTRFLEALNDDLNTPEALGIFFDFINKKNKKIHDNLLLEKDIKESQEFIAGFNATFHIVNESSLKNQKIPSEVQKLASLREKMRNQQKWEEADKLRGEIEKLGWLIEDLKDFQKLLKKK